MFPAANPPSASAAESLRPQFDFTQSDVRVPLPALGTGFRLRIDPPGTGGKVVFASIRFERRETFTATAMTALGKHAGRKRES